MAALLTTTTSTHYLIVEGRVLVIEDGFALSLAAALTRGVGAVAGYLGLGAGAGSG